MSATTATHELLSVSRRDDDDSPADGPTSIPPSQLALAVTQPPTSVRMDPPTDDTPVVEHTPFGVYLARAREAKKLTLDDLAHVTKIRRAILESLEHNARRDLPEKVFVLGYVRSYAAAVGLNVEEAVRRCSADWDDESKAIALEEFAAKKSRSWAWVWPTLAAACFAAGIWFIVHLR